MSDIWEGSDPGVGVGDRGRLQSIFDAELRQDRRHVVRHRLGRNEPAIGCGTGRSAPEGVGQRTTNPLLIDGHFHRQPAASNVSPTSSG